MYPDISQLNIDVKRKGCQEPLGILVVQVPAGQLTGAIADGFCGQTCARPQDGSIKSPQNAESKIYAPALRSEISNQSLIPRIGNKEHQWES